MRTIPFGIQPALDQITSICHQCPEISAWLKENVDKGADINELVETMVMSGMPPDGAAGLAMLAGNGLTFGSGLGVDSRLSMKNLLPGTPEGVEHAEKHVLDLNGQVVRKVMSIGGPDCVLYENFLTDEECEVIKKTAEPMLGRSAVVGKDSAGMETRIRTSRGAFLRRRANEDVTRVEERIEALTGYPIVRGEGLQVLHYQDAQEYQPHFDFFEPMSEADHAMLVEPGNRIGTLILYLNDVEEGGATYFPQINLAIHPKKGSAIWFSYLGQDGVFDRRTQHAGLPVITGDKWIATKWIRERNFMADTAVERY